jgi:hypothetical protein
MRTSLRATIGVAVALGVLMVSAVAFGSSPRSDKEAGSDTPGTGQGDGGTSAMCAPDHPDCDDMIVNPDPGSLDDPVVGVPPEPGDDPAPQPQVVEPRPGMVNVFSTAFDTATIGEDDRTLTITFWSGIEPCSVLDHVEVRYGADAVTVTLYQGSDPNAKDVACIEIAVLKQVTITLDEPLAGRAILDGAA